MGDFYYLSVTGGGGRRGIAVLMMAQCHGHQPLALRICKAWMEWYAEFSLTNAAFYLYSYG